jgi:hypothetical protein
MTILASRSGPGSLRRLQSGSQHQVQEARTLTFTQHTRPHGDLRSFRDCPTGHGKSLDHQFFQDLEWLLRANFGHSRRSAFDPDVWSGRALREVFVDLASAVLHQCIRSLILEAALAAVVDTMRRLIVAAPAAIAHAGPWVGSCW